MMPLGMSLGIIRVMGVERHDMIPETLLVSIQDMPHDMTQEMIGILVITTEEIFAMMTGMVDVMILETVQIEAYLS